MEVYGDHATIPLSGCRAGGRDTGPDSSLHERLMSNIVVRATDKWRQETFAYLMG